MAAPREEPRPGPRDGPADRGARPTLALERVVVRDVRNLERVELEPAARVNVITGSNGHGKTSLLEAIYFVATSRSFRTSRTAELVRHGAEAATVRARFTEIGGALPPLGRAQTATVAGARGDGSRSAGPVARVRVDDNRPSSLAEFATRSPVVVFHPDELALSSGPALGRRTMLDRLALFTDPASSDHRARYARALRARQRLLHGATRPGARGGADVDAFETLCAEHGAALTSARRAAAEALQRELVTAFARIAAPELELVARYSPGGSEDPAEAREALRSQRARDAHRSSAGFGPHRDDLSLSLDGHPARVVASQGQHRALTLALKAAEAATVAGIRGIEPILLLDDVSSELDPDRTIALFSFLGLARGQIFLTTTRRSLIVTPGVDASDRRDFHVERGSVVASS